jgi:serine O-acetyltransferase
MGLLAEEWKADRARYALNAWTSEPALWAVAIYRFGQAAAARPGLMGKLQRRVHSVLHLLMRATVNIELPPGARFGPGLLIYHQGPIVVNAGARVGARCKLRQGVTIGVATTGGGAPVIGDDVFFGANAQVLGPVTIGDGVTIASGAVVVSDVPAGATVGGVPAKVIGAPAVRGDAAAVIGDGRAHGPSNASGTT